MDLKDIQNLIKFVAKSGASEVKLEMGDVKVTIKTGKDDKEESTTYVQQIPVSAPVAQVQATQPPVAETPASSTEKSSTDDSKYITIKSPIIGTFYRKSAPDKPVFVEVGQTIAEGDVLCIIEAMKLFNEIESEISGKVVKILVDDASPVEFDQPLFLVDPS
ncbi:acetyl-CoA carboxylase biotin carboxyl carrier protein [Yeosuana sp. MJ-SS3]|jgi:acetyl-CoA carboxylase biotin carboxyl carrier protein|uniref:Biotin carboxyl carrier protein of acetyl-CoA carboxylase n=1 Tax=Gilvirhabdus luticola TaxID=3079858 RepID=A0ABU3U2W4_9FLAO|nr:acetyl-CoA carboxylase biotin carboxyl carrier protein [Yeosuana sp. MJ-SS3]MDU8884733.1 acetyl-CoA carboxylase biotin carboxyl carrier protein [Yeosuana sp. MJ-SS3]